MKHVIFKSAQVNSFCLDALKRIEKIIRENVFELKKKKPELKFYPGLALMDLRSTGPRAISKKGTACLLFNVMFLSDFLRSRGSHCQVLTLGGRNLQYGTKFLRVLIFAFCAIFPAIRKNKFPQIKITETFFPQKFTPEEIFSSLNSQLKNTALRNRVCSITTCLFHSETKRYTTKYWSIV